jgi:hypothetical protein
VEPSLDAIQRECQLNGHRLLNPERAVIVEGRDALRLRDESRRARGCDFPDEL